MKGESKVKLYGTRGSPFSLRVELALKVKGIAYEYVEEDLKNKSESLIKYNPVHKKVPVLVHNGKPTAESLVILEYIDETWKNHSPRFLPDDPYKRARVRFWASFLHLQLFESMRGVIITDGEAQEKAIKEVSEKLKMVEEEGMVDFFPSPAAASSISYESLELHHIVLCSIFASYKAAEEAIGVKLIDPEKNPLIYSCVTALNEMPAVKETKPSHEKTVGLLKFIRQNALQAAKA